MEGLRPGFPDAGVARLRGETLACHELACSPGTPSISLSPIYGRESGERLQRVTRWLGNLEPHQCRLSFWKRRVHEMLAKFVVRVIPAKAGIQICNVTVRFKAIDFRFRGNDGVSRTGLRFLGRASQSTFNPLTLSERAKSSKSNRLAEIPG
jgi:hypothetical protein